MSVDLARDTVDRSAAPAIDRLDPTNEVLRDITRGGLAGVIVGVLIAGIGGRLVMRLAAVLVPDATGAVTEQEFVIGRITLVGSLGLILAMGMLVGAIAGSLWVVVRPWLPASATTRAILSIPIAWALGTSILVNDANPDFVILRHHPAVVGALVVLVAMFGPALVLVDGWLERRLPHARVTGDSRVVTVYAVVTAIGLLLTLLVALPFYLGSEIRVAGFAMLVVGLCTLATWWYRVERRRPAPPRVAMVARVALPIAVVAGLAVTTREVAGALAIA